MNGFDFYMNLELLFLMLDEQLILLLILLQDLQLFIFNLENFLIYNE